MLGILLKRVRIELGYEGLGFSFKTFEFLLKKVSRRSSSESNLNSVEWLSNGGPLGIGSELHAELIARTVQFNRSKELFPSLSLYRFKLFPIGERWRPRLM